ncbi:hypothetical protein YC2023_093544 [Brassica napus]
MGLVLFYWPYKSHLDKPNLLTLIRVRPSLSQHPIKSSEGALAHDPIKVVDGIQLQCKLAIDGKKGKPLGQDVAVGLDQWVVVMVLEVVHIVYACMVLAF